LAALQLTTSALTGARLFGRTALSSEASPLLTGMFNPMNGVALNIQTKELYASPNGDRWYLAFYPESGRVFVQHVPNLPSGGEPKHIELADFLGRGGNAPEQQALLRLIGGLTDYPGEAGDASIYRDRPTAGNDE
jgi:hypothetical protein